mgnify:CR=1 FL=1
MGRIHKSINVLAIVFLAFVSFTLINQVKLEAETCPANITGHWVGAYGTQESPNGAIETDFTNPSWNNQLTGVAKYKFDVNDQYQQANWTSTISCNTWAGQATLSTGQIINFSGTISPDGNTMQATFTPGGGQYWLVRQPNDPVKVGISDTTIMEGDPGTSKSETVTISLTSPSTQAIAVVYRIDPVDTDGQDFDCRKCGVNQKVTFNVLSTGKTALTKNIPIKVWGDSITENNEQVKVTIVSVAGASGVINNEALVTIKNDD